MGYCFVTSNCIGCGVFFSYNPHRVPSISIEGDRKPICRICVERANPKRKANGLDPIVLSPDAYEPIHESEL